MSTNSHVIRRQKPVRGGRFPLGPSVLKEIKDAIENDARELGVSKSFVISVILANAYGITKQEQLYESKPIKLRRVK